MPNIPDQKKVIRIAEDICKKRGLRLTQQRQQVLSILSLHGKPMGAYDILQAVQETSPKAAPPMIYRALEFLLEIGLIHKLETIHAYMGCSHPDHQHAGQFLICDHCGEVTELDDTAITSSVNNAAHATGFKPAHDVVEVLGTCADCLK